MYEVTRHLWRTKDGRLVPTGHVDAEILAYARGDQIPDDIAAREGLVTVESPPPAIPTVEVVPPLPVIPTEVPPADAVVPADQTPAPGIADVLPEPVQPVKKRTPRKKVSGVTINRSGGSADG